MKKRNLKVVDFELYTLNFGHTLKKGEEIEIRKTLKK